MLILSRRRDERIMVGDDVEIIVVDIRGGDKVRLGITAPRNVQVHRKEVYEAIKRENQALQEIKPDVSPDSGQDNGKVYLGDSVYAEFDGYAFVLTTQNDESGPSNTIVLEPEILRAFDMIRMRQSKGE